MHVIFQFIAFLLLWTHLKGATGTVACPAGLFQAMINDDDDDDDDNDEKNNDL